MKNYKPNHSPRAVFSSALQVARRWLAGSTILVLVLQLVASAIVFTPAAQAAVVPSPIWPTSWTTPNTCVSDISDESPTEADILGDVANPAVGFSSDANFQYFRERLEGNPGTVSSLKNSAWVVLLQLATPNYQYLASVDGDHNKVQLWQNTTISGPIDFNPVFHDQAETKRWEGNSTDYARVTLSGGAYYMDWAVPVTELASRGITSTATKYFATSQTSSNYNKDYLNCYEAIADVSITKSDSPDPVDGAGTLTYTITAANGGPESASDVMVSDVLPGNVTYVSSSASVSSYNSGTGQWSVGTLTNGGSATLTINVTLNSGSSVTNTASVLSSTTDSNTSNNSATATTTVNAPPNSAPVASNSSVTTNEDTAVSGTVVATDADSDPLTYSVVTGPSNGSLTAFNTSTGAFTYAPNANYNGADSFTFKANDGSLNSNVATVSITVTAVNDAPVAANDSYTTAEDTVLTVSAPGVLANDSDVDSAIFPAVDTNPSRGSVVVNLNGSFTYTPDANYNGPDSFTYHATDGSLNSNVATVSITVTPANDAPVAVDDNYSTNEDTALIVAAPGVLTNDTDAEGDTLTATVVASPANGSLSLNSDGSFTYTPTANYNGSDSFTYRANDGSLNSNVATVSITVTAVNDAPVANDDGYSTNEDTQLIVSALGVLTNDTDVEGSGLTSVLVVGPSNGTLTLNSDGSFTYTPDPDFNGTDSFTYRANDGSANSNVATVTINVTNANDTPVANADAYSMDEDATLTVSAPGVLSNDTDVDGNSLTAAVVDSPAHGSVTLNSDGSFTYTPNANYNGTDSFTYKANDGSADSGEAVVTITINPVNDAPVAIDQAVSTNEDTPISGTVSATDADSGDVLTYSIVANPTNGTLTAFDGPTGGFTYTPNANYNGSDSFTFKANDGSLDSNVATVSITVTAVNDAPVANNDTYATNEDVALTVSAPGVLTNDTDTEGEWSHCRCGY